MSNINWKTPFSTQTGFHPEIQGIGLIDDGLDAEDPVVSEIEVKQENERLRKKAVEIVNKFTRGKP